MKALIGLAVAFIAGTVAMYGVMHWRDNAKIVALQAHADSVARVAAAKDSAATRLTDSVQATIAKLDTVERHSTDVAALADKRVKVFHDALHATVAHDSAASAQLDSMTRAFAQDTLARHNAIVAANAKVVALQADNAMLLQTVHALNGQVQDLNAQIQKLNHKTMPKWLDLGLTWGQRALAVKGLADVLRGR